MPAVYMSYEIKPEMSIKERQTQLYLGVMSAGEQAYTLGAAIAECRKQLTSLDDLVRRMDLDLLTLRKDVRGF